MGEGSTLSPQKIFFLEIMPESLGYRVLNDTCRRGLLEVLRECATLSIKIHNVQEPKKSADNLFLRITFLLMVAGSLAVLL